MFETDSDHPTLRVSLWGAVVLTVVSLVLGYLGYRALALSPLDAFFGTLQMFALDAPRDLPAESVALGVARFTAPLALVLASVVAVTAVIGQTVRHAARLRRVKAHVVVLGLSDNSTEFANELLEQGRRVVVVEADGEHSGLQAMKRSGAMVVVGDASREATQRLAHVERSSRVVVSTGDDGRNLRTAETAAGLLVGSRETTIHVLLEDYWLHEELARTEFMTSAAAGPEIDFVHRADYEAAAFIEAVTTASPASLESEVILFEGNGERGRRTLIHLARRNLLLGVKAAIVVDGETRRSVVEPELSSSPWLAEAMSPGQPTDAAPGVCIVAASDPDGAALGRGLRLALAHPTSEVFVLTDFPVGESLLQRNAAIRAVPAGSIAISPTSLFAHSWVETLARARHQIYCALEVQREPTRRPTRRSSPGCAAGVAQGVEPGLRSGDLQRARRSFHCTWFPSVACPEARRRCRTSRWSSWLATNMTGGRRSRRARAGVGAPPRRIRRTGPTRCWSTGRISRRRSGRRTGTVSARSPRCWPWSGWSCSPTRRKQRPLAAAQACRATAWRKPPVR